MYQHTCSSEGTWVQWEPAPLAETWQGVLCEREFIQKTLCCPEQVVGEGAGAGAEGEGGKFTVDLMDQFFRDPNMQQVMKEYSSVCCSTSVVACRHRVSVCCLS